MDASCLIGLCGAQAQELAASASQAAGGSSSNLARNLSIALTVLGIVVILLSQWFARRLLGRYRSTLLKSMSSDAGLGDAGECAGWDAQRIVHAMENRRRRVLGVLIGVILVYSAAAAKFYSFGATSGGGTVLSNAVTFLLFLAFSGPVALLGVSAVGFARHFWGVFAPAAFVAAAMQVVVAGSALQGAVPLDAGQILTALASVIVLAMGAMTVSRRMPTTWWQRAAAALRRWRWRLLGGGVLAFLLVLGSTETGDVVLPQISRFTQVLLLGCLVAAIAIIVCYLTMAERTSRVMVPLVGLGLMTIAVVAMPAALVLPWLMPQSWPTVLSTFVQWFVPLALGIVAARTLLRGVAWAYDRKVFSDAQFQVYTWMLAVTCIFGFSHVVLIEDGTLFDRRNLSLALATVSALVAYSVLTRLFVRPLPLQRRLLVLRVFSRVEGRESLLEDLEYRWRFIGPIVLIGAPDFASSTLDPGDAARYLRTFKVKDVFVDTIRQLERRLLNMDEAPDSDGRFRVNEFFCRNDTWEPAVEMLLESSEAVLVDLREFDASRGGTRKELQMLDRHDALARTVFLVGPKTDLDDIAHALNIDSADRLAEQVQLIDETSPQRHALVETLVRRMPPEPLPGLLLQPRRQQALPQAEKHVHAQELAAGHRTADLGASGSSR